MKGWISVNDQLPESACLAFYNCGYRGHQIVVAKYIKRYSEEANFDFGGDGEGISEYSEDKDCYYYVEGWWELIQNWDEYGFVQIHEGLVTHWMPLPSPPESPDA